MTCKERVIAALNHKESDIVPYSISFTIGELEKMKKFTGNENYLSTINNHISGTSYNGVCTELPDRPGFFKDDFGVIWNRSGPDKDIGVIEGVLIPEPNISLYKFPEIDEEKIRKYCKGVENQTDKFRHGGIGFSLFERAWTLRGMENLLMDMVLNPSFVHDLLNAIVEYDLKILDIHLEYDFEGMYFGDDWGQQRGLIMGPAMWREFIKPHLARLYSHVKSKGKYVLQHSCGDIEEIYEDLIEIGLDAHQTFQPEIFDIEKVKEKYGGRLSFWGGISTQALLPVGTPEEVRNETVRIMKIMSKNGGFIAAPTHGVPHDVPAENIIALVDVFENQDKYF